MRNYIITALLFLPVHVFAQPFDCSKVCIVHIEEDTVPGYLLVTIYNGDSVHVNYPTVQVIDSNGDTIGNPAATFDLFAQLGNDTTVHRIPFTGGSFPVNFSGTVLFTDQIYDTTCAYSYPMPCSQFQRVPDCNDMVVTAITVDTVTDLMHVTIFNNCTNCDAGIDGPVYCELQVYSASAPFNTIGAANCHCFLTPGNQSSQVYTINSYTDSLPPVEDLTVSFNCGGGLCDTLLLNFPQGLDEDPVIPGFSVFPNPFTGQLHIEPGNFSGESSLILMGVDGRLIHSQVPAESNVDLSHLAPGIYFLTLNSGGIVWTHRVVKAAGMEK